VQHSAARSANQDAYRDSSEPQPASAYTSLQYSLPSSSDLDGYSNPSVGATDQDGGRSVPSHDRDFPDSANPIHANPRPDQKRARELSASPRLSSTPAPHFERKKQTSACRACNTAHTTCSHVYGGQVCDRCARMSLACLPRERKRRERRL